MKAVQVQVTDSDFRYFKVEDGYRYGIYLERNRPYPNNARNNLCVYRVPEGTRAPYGRIPDELLVAMADAELKVVEPEVIARFPMFSAWYPIEDAPGDTVFEELRILPSSLKDSQQAYVQPPNAMVRIDVPPVAAPAKSAVVTQARPVEGTVDDG